ncbi:DNA polymerase III subunit gamma/tau [Acidobacteriota bacterium]
MSYEIYARKYRPATFEAMIGQNHVVQTLQNAIKHNRIAQAYIFSGMRGVGKTTTARILAKALNCQGEKGDRTTPTPTPCNKCDACNQIKDDRSVDVQEIDGASNRGIDEVRSLRDGIKYKPIQLRYKVIIIDEVHMLTREAFNALLKTLEEPPPHTLFIFATTEFHKVPPTIVSRCQHFEFKKITHRDLVNHLIHISDAEDIKLSPLGMDLIAAAADGSVRDVQSLLDQAVAFSGESISDDDLKEILGTINREILFDISKSIFAETADQIFFLVDKIMDKGYDLRFFYAELIQHFRRLLIVKTLDDPKDLLPLDESDLKIFREIIKDVGAEDILRYLTALQQAEQGLKFSSHPRIYLEMTLVKLCHFKKLVDLKKLIEDVKNKTFSSQGPSVYKTRKESPPVNRPGGPSGSRNPVRPEIKKEPTPSVRERTEKLTPLKDRIKPNSETKKQEPPLAFGERKKEREIDKALKDPTVKSFMDTFKAQILSAEPVKKSEKK